MNAKIKILYCQFVFDNGDVCGTPMECPSTSRRKFCDAHKRMHQAQWAKKYKESGKMKDYSDSRENIKVRKMSPDYPARRATMIEQYGVKGGRAQCEHMVLRGVKY